MSKPDWKYAPDWAEWLAQDHYGAWGWYEEKPKACSQGACWDIVAIGNRWRRPADWRPGLSFVKNTGWRKTLESRPQ